MKGYINTSNYYLSTITSNISASGVSGSFTVSEITVDWVTLPEQWYYWVDVDFWDPSKREIFKIKNRVWYTLYYDNRISPYWLKTHDVWASVWLRDFSQLLNSLSANTDNFWEIERNWLHIKVFWGNVNISGTSYVSVETAELDVPANSTRYVEYDTVANTFVLSEQLTDDNFPIAKIVTADAGIQVFEDLRAVLVAAKDWDMKKTVYDPQNVNDDAFNMDNMTDGTDKHYVTDADKEWWSGKQDHLISWQNIKTINWYNILWDGNINIAPSIWFDWAYEVSWLWISTYTIQNDPITNTSFMVFVNSGTGIFPTSDYSYNSTTKVITLNTPLENDERLIVWVMKPNGTTIDPLDIGRGIVTITKDWNSHSFWVNQTNDTTIDLWTVWTGTVIIKNWENTISTFWVNDTIDTTVQLWDLVKNWWLTLKSWWTTLATFTANQATDVEVNFEKSILVTADEYAALPSSKNTDWNFYFIYS